MSQRQDKSVSAETEKRLEAMILSGTLKIGDQLPTEREIAEQLDISRGAAHSAVAELARKGFLRVVPRHGAYVADYVRNGTLDVLNAIAEYDGGNIDRAMAESVIWTRYALECLPVTLLAKKHTKEQMIRLNMLVGEMRRRYGGASKKDSLELAEKIQDFFQTRCLMSGNLVIPVIVGASSGISLALTRRWIDKAGADAVISGLENTMKYIESGDSEGAAASLRRNISSALEAV